MFSCVYGRQSHPRFTAIENVIVSAILVKVTVFDKPNKGFVEVQFT